MDFFKSKEEKAAIVAAEAAYASLLDGLRSDPGRLMSLAGDLQAAFDAGHRQHLPTDDADRMRHSLVESATEIVLADDRLTVEEEGAFLAALAKLGITNDTMDALAPGLLDRLVVANVNDHRLPVIDEPHLLSRPGEVVHLETMAQLLKTVAIREYQGGSQGVSLRIMKGVSYRVGAMRGKMVTVGSETVVADEGIFSVTDRQGRLLGQLEDPRVQVRQARRHQALQRRHPARRHELARTPACSSSATSTRSRPS